MDYLYLYCQEFCRKSLDKVAFIEEHYLERAILITNIFSENKENMIIADDSGRDTFTVNVLNSFHREIRGDDRGFSVFLAMIQAKGKVGIR